MTTPQLMRRDAVLAPGTTLEVTVSTVYQIVLDDDWTAGLDEPLTLENIERILGRYSPDRIRTLRSDYDIYDEEILGWAITGVPDTEFESPYQQQQRLGLRPYFMSAPEYVEISDAAEARS